MCDRYTAFPPAVPEFTPDDNMMSHLLLLWDCKIHIFLLFMVFYNRHAEKLFTSLPFTSCTIKFL